MQEERILAITLCGSSEESQVHNHIVNSRKISIKLMGNKKKRSAGPGSGIKADQEVEVVVVPDPEETGVVHELFRRYQSGKRPPLQLGDICRSAECQDVAGEPGST